jgi:hypothetical protein
LILKRKPESFQYQRVGYLRLVLWEDTMLKDEDLARSQPLSLDKERNMLRIGKESVGNAVMEEPIFQCVMIAGGSKEFVFRRLWR